MLKNHIDGVTVSILASSAVDHGFELRLGQAKDYKGGIYSFCAKLAALRRNNTDWFWLRIRIMCPSGVTCLFADCCFSELAI